MKNHWIIKHWSEMNLKEKIKAYKFAINSKNVKDSFQGFCKIMHNSMIEVSTGKVIELY